MLMTFCDPWLNNNLRSGSKRFTDRKSLKKLHGNEYCNFYGSELLVNNDTSPWWCPPYLIKPGSFDEPLIKMSHIYEKMPLKNV